MMSIPSFWVRSKFILLRRRLADSFSVDNCRGAKSDSLLAWPLRENGNSCRLFFFRWRFEIPSPKSKEEKAVQS